MDITDDILMDELANRFARRRKAFLDQKIIFDLLSDKKTDFLIPDYQRPYAWGEECNVKLFGMIFFYSPSQIIIIMKPLMKMKSIFLALLSHSKFNRR